MTEKTQEQKEMDRLNGCLRTCIKAMNVGTPEFVKGKPHYAFLALKEHPYAREMLRQLLAAGFPPAVVVEEEHAVATEEREKFLKRIGRHAEGAAPSVAEQCTAAGVERVECPQHNLSGCLAHLARVKPRLLVLGGTRIIKEPVLSFPLDGCINAHPGLLPECRGSASPAWSVYHDIPIGSTCHVCSPGIDEGDILRRREVPVKRGDDYADLCYGTLCMSGTLMTEAVAHYAEHGNFDSIRTKQGQSTFETFRNAPDEVVEAVHKKLADQTYKHYID